MPLRYEFIEYPLSLRKLMGFNDVCGLSATGRDMGAQLFGGFFNRDGYSILNYNFGVFNGEGLNVKDKNKTQGPRGAADAATRPADCSSPGSYYWGEYGADYLKRVRYGAGACYDERTGRSCAASISAARRGFLRAANSTATAGTPSAGWRVTPTLLSVPCATIRSSKTRSESALAADQLHGGRRVAAREIPALPAQLHLRRLCVPAPPPTAMWCALMLSGIF